MNENGYEMKKYGVTIPTPSPEPTEPTPTPTHTTTPITDIVTGPFGLILILLLLL